MLNVFGVALGSCRDNVALDEGRVGVMDEEVMVREEALRYKPLAQKPTTRDGAHKFSAHTFRRCWFQSSFTCRTFTVLCILPAETTTAGPGRGAIVATL